MDGAGQQRCGDHQLRRDAVHRCDGAAGPTFAVAATSQVVTGLTNGTVYTFTVTAVNSRGTGLQSPNAPITRRHAVGAADRVGGPGQRAGDGLVDGAGEQRLGDHRLPVTPFIGTTRAGTAAVRVDGDEPGDHRPHERDDVHLRRRGGERPGHRSGDDVEQRHGRFADGAGLVTATAGAGKATVTWSASANNGSAITGYIVTPVKAGVAQAPITVRRSALTRTITGLTPGTAYTFKVAATNSRGTGPQSAPRTP